MLNSVYKTETLAVSGLPKQYKITKQLGSGSYGTVYSAVDANTDQIVAIKVMKNVFSHLVDWKRILREITLLRQMDSPYIVKMLDWGYLGNKGDFESIYIVLEHGKSDLRKLLKSGRSLTPRQVKLIMNGIMKGLAYLQSNKILHRDIKPANILIDEKYNIKICDFGLARSVADFYVDTKKNELSDEKIQEMYLSTRNTETLSTEENDMDSDDLNYSFDVENLCSPVKLITDDSIENQKICSPNLGNKKPKITQSDKVSSSIDDLVISVKARITDASDEKPLKPKRKLTSHVVTRWYRSPELILCCDTYDFSIDIWSAGWVFAEILQLLSPCKFKNLNYNILFQGESCYPLSPAHKIWNKMDGFPINVNDQMSEILKFVRSCDLSKVSEFISDDRMKKYLRNLSSTKNKKSFKNLLPEVGNEALDLLKKLLAFNPQNRISAEEWLNHAYFENLDPKIASIYKNKSPIRKLSEKKVGSIFLEFEEELTEEYNEEEIRKLYMREYNLIWQTFKPADIFEDYESQITITY